jgi:hypothetical protein
MREAELVHPLGVGAHSADVRTDLGLRKDDPDLHSLCSTTEHASGAPRQTHRQLSVMDSAGKIWFVLQNKEREG